MGTTLPANAALVPCSGKVTPLAPLHTLHATKIAVMNLPETITFHGGPATVVEAQDLDPLEFTLDGTRYAEHSLPAQTPESDLVVNVVGLPDAGHWSGWVLLLG